MRGLIVGQIMDSLPERYDSIRWECVAALHYSIRGGDTNSKAFRKSLSTYFIPREDIEALQDRELLAFHNLVQRRLYVCM